VAEIEKLRNQVVEVKKKMTKYEASLHKAQTDLQAR
jgi:hypothetical protein